MEQGIAYDLSGTSASLLLVFIPNVAAIWYRQYFIFMYRCAIVHSSYRYMLI